MKTKLFLLSLALFALHLGARAQDTSIVFGTAFYISGGVAQGGTGIVYQWQCNGNNIEDATNKDYTTLTTLKPGFYTYVRKSVCEQCGGRWQYSNPHTIEVICPNPGATQPVFSAAPTTVCTGAEFTYSVTSAANTTYQWTFPAGWGQTDGGNSNSVKVKAGTVADSVGVVAIDTLSGCASTARKMKVATVNTQPTLTLTTNNATGQRVFASRAIADISYTRTGTATTNTFAWTGTSSGPTAPTGITAATGTTNSITGTPTVAGTYGYTITVTATGCTTVTTAPCSIYVAAACATQFYDGKCYTAQGSVAYNSTSCPSGYSKASYTLAKHLSSTLNGVAFIFTGNRTSASGTQSILWGSDFDATGIWGGNGVTIGANSPYAVKLGTDQELIAWNVKGGSTTDAAVGILCSRNP